MNTRDGYEIKIGDTLCNHLGESLLVRELFPESDGPEKLIVTPQFLVESMIASGAGGYHSEIDVECEYEAEDTVVLAADVFLYAPTARISEEIQAKKDELKGLCERIGLAKVELRFANEESAKGIKEAKAATEKAQADLSEIRQMLSRSLDATK